MTVPRDIIWKNGIEYRGVDPFAGERTLCEVAIATPCVTVSNAAEYDIRTLEAQMNFQRTFSDVNHKCTGNRWGINPLAGHVLYL